MKVSAFLENDLEWLLNKKKFQTWKSMEEHSFLQRSTRLSGGNLVDGSPPARHGSVSHIMSNTEAVGRSHGG